MNQKFEIFENLCFFQNCAVFCDDFFYFLENLISFLQNCAVFCDDFFYFLENLISFLQNCAIFLENTQKTFCKMSFLCYHKNMEKRNIIIKSLITALFAAATFGLQFWVIFKEDVKFNLLQFFALAIPFVMALVFIRKSERTILLAGALLFSTAAQYLLIVQPLVKPFKNIELIAICLLCGTSFMFFLHTFFVNKAIGMKVVNIAARVLFCLLVYFILPKYKKIDTIEMIQIMILINNVVTLAFLAFSIKQNWILFLGILLIVASDVFVFLAAYGVELFNISAQFLEFLLKYDMAFYTLVPGLFLVACSSVWEKNKVKLM